MNLIGVERELKTNAELIIEKKPLNSGCERTTNITVAFYSYPPTKRLY